VSFIRVNKTPGAPPDALDRLFGLFSDAMRRAGRAPNAVAPQAAALIRHVSEVTSAGASVDAAAARGVAGGPASGVLNLTPDDVERLLGERCRRVLEATQPPVWRASAGLVESRLARAADAKDRDGSVLTLLEAESRAATLRRRPDTPERDVLETLRSVLNGTGWISEVPERDQLREHFASLDDVEPR